MKNLLLIFGLVLSIASYSQSTAVKSTGKSSGGSGSANPTAITFNGSSIPFNNINGQIMPYRVTSNLTITPDTSTSPQSGSSVLADFIGDGTHTIAFSGFSPASNSVVDSFINTDSWISTYAFTKVGRYTYKYGLQDFKLVNGFTAAPTISSITTNATGDTITFTFSKAMQATPSSTGLTFSPARTITSFFRGTNTSQLKAVVAVYDYGDVITASYTPGTIISLNGGILASFTSTSVTNAIPAYDVDAQAYFTAISLSNIAQKRIINTFVKGLKTDSIWTLDFPKDSSFIHLQFWSTLTADAYNLVNPVNDTTKFHLDYVGGIYASTAGVKPNGSTGYAKTYYNPTLRCPANNIHLAFYSVQDTTVAPTGANSDIDIGSSSNAFANRAQFVTKNDQTSHLAVSLLYNVTSMSAPNNTVTTGFYIASRIANNYHFIYKNGVILGSVTTNSTTGTQSNRSLYIFASNNGGTVGNFSARRAIYDSAGRGMPQFRALKYSNRVNTMMTALSLNTY